MFSLARGLCNRMIITKSTDGFVFHVEFSHRVNICYCSTLVCIFKDVTIYTELLLAASLVFVEARYAPVSRWIKLRQNYCFCLLLQGCGALFF